MSQPPILWCGSTLVVFDGPRRLTWRRGPRGEWFPVSLWPTPQQALQVNEHLAQGGGLLVLVEEAETEIPLHTEELAGAPWELADRVTVEDGLAELRVPALDWLPEELQARGRKFLKDSACFFERQPDLLIPHLVVEPLGPTPENLRFGRLRPPRRCTDERLRTVADHLFDHGLTMPRAPESLGDDASWAPMLETIS
ncbi:hypothetical protein [Streptomyces sedi]|uniref:Uncharacterized protein n=1 Tax=Streptomyces sedi TaxID=555059 RepID=A0A5C4VBY8_9ACTN|nr:hypothetical protein [Streptomyces sedi]TNM33407.1 hypothetical protein FH715_03325 [Streptomyces sedi]